MAAAQDPPVLPLDGRVAIVTGASSSIGRAIAIYLASLGARLVLNYASSSSSSHARILILPPPRPLLEPSPSTPTSPANVKSLFNRAESFFGTAPHTLIACAGVFDSKYPSLADTAVEDWDAIFSVNARGAFLCCREAANRLQRGGGGRIITVSSSLVGALRPECAAYTASKAAVEAMTRILAKELKGMGITANCVALGPVATDLFFAGKSEEAVRKVVEECPLGRLGETKDIARVVGFLATDAAEWVNGKVIRIVSGLPPLNFFYAETLA